MNTFLSDNTFYCCDMIKIESGEILSVCGNFEGLHCRARLTFYPQNGATRLIEDAQYIKASYETGYIIPDCKKLLDLPGEQHFLVRRSQIETIYRASDAFDKLAQPYSERCENLLELFSTNCHVDRDHQGLTGSGALNCIQHTSDFDWIVYEQDPSAIEAYVTSNSNFKRELTFDMNHVYRKYSVFKGLNKTDIDYLFQDRWKYFRFQDMLVSINFVNPLSRADKFLSLCKLGKRMTLKGEITDAVGCYDVPKVIRFVSEGKSHRILTWLFLYNGAFRNGDTVQLSGRECSFDDETYILVEESQDSIRKLTDKKG